MKPSLQFDTREHAEQAAAVLRESGIKYEISPILSDGGQTYPEFVNFKAGGFLLSIEEARWEEGMKKIWESN
jgi:hypothetical protein